MTTNDPPELAEPRPDEQLPTEKLLGYLRERLPETEGEASVQQFPGGRANLTYQITFGDTAYVLRRPPLGPVAPSAHDMGREYRVLSKLASHFRLAPRSYLYCDDESIIGAPFQVMERRHGLVIRERIPAPHAGDPALCKRIGEMLVDALAELHRVDREQAGLGDLGRPEGFIERQLEGWAKRWHAAKNEDSPRMDALIGWLQTHRVASELVSLIHNDYKLDNVMVTHADPGTAVAILDWDMCTSGDPLSDLGYLLNQWCEAGDDPAWIEAAAMPTQEPGFPSRDQAIERYAAQTCFDVDHVGWYYAFAAMKFAVIIQQIYIRYLRGQTQDTRFAGFGERVRLYIEKGAAIAGI